MSTSLVIDVAASDEALQQLREARRRNHRRVVHWVDAFYKVYVTALGVAIFIVVASGWFPGPPLDAAGQAQLAADGPAWLGLAFAVAVGLGLRSGGRGGPLTLEAPTVFHELMAPVNRAAALRGPAVKQVRFLAFAGAVTGAVLGVLGARRVTVNPIEVVVACGVAVSLVAVLTIASAMALSGRRIGIWAANGLALVVLAWSGADIAAHVTTSPLTLLASIAFWPLQVAPLAVIGVLVVGLVVWLAFAGVGGTSIESARKRAGLVSQLRFAVTLQDIRTVVLLRRQLASETPRARPWIRTKRAGRLPAVWRRDWQGFLRFPGARIARLIALGAAAGLAAGFAWRGTAPAIVGAALALYLAGYEAVEPIAQETDHPTRWDGNGGEFGMALLRHLPAAVTLMVLVCGIAGATALLLVPATVVTHLLPIVILPAAGAAALGAALSTVQGSNTVNSIVDTGEMTKMDLSAVGLDPNTAGFMQVFRWAFPPGMGVAALAPLLAAGHDPENLNTQRVSNLTTWSLLLLVGVAIWIRTRRPARI